MTSGAFGRGRAHPFILLALLAAALSAGGCGEVKKCKKGTEGCVDGQPFTSGDKAGGCSFGLIAKGNKCVEPEGNEPGDKEDGGAPSGDAGRDAGRDGSTPVDNCDCAADEVCSPEDAKTCLSYCDVEPELSAVSPPPGCRDYTGETVKLLPYKTACTNTCLQFCKRAEIFCPGFVCDPTTCDSTVQTAFCATECPGNNVNCMTDGCESIRDSSCADFICPDAFPKSCTDVRCTDSCAAINLADGYCDDGEPLSASYAYCAYGTDCADCGPRRGPKPPVSALGGQCVRDVGCPGFDPDFLKTDSWCLNVPETPPTQFACIPNCTGHEDEVDYCGDGFKCQGIEYTNGDPFLNSMGRQGYGCVPQVCK